MKRTVLIIGGSPFGVALAKQLANAGAEVTIGDKKAARMQDIEIASVNVVPLDATEEAALGQPMVTSADVVVVSTGRSVQAGIYAALLLKHLKISHVFACAADEKCARLLQQIGAEIVWPLQESPADVAGRILREVNASHLGDGTIQRQA